MRKAWLAGIVVLFLGLIVSGCASNSSNTKKEKMVSLYVMSSFSAAKEGTLRVVSDSEEIAMWHKAMSDSIQRQGIVNMADPHYKVDLGEQVYFLWIEEDRGTVMNVQDSHTIRTLTPKYAKAAYAALQSHYPSHTDN
ncbi:hypothetical protein D3P07_18935 [Paenibacillus sp. 1011MAR3C5]|uniref:hypothetical protein n=1 Tax=Paenibacillus sp. 1011MAR3C5 TaxID=1675787 RepID=UPI000E6C2938|nr:hypothetical protein [Paenibacillus sp. 1011MAR3C5]RJE86158.1 hypothetical protein D3P07_18935 [Paenibacillus sp. 1011MAR3C5]